MWWRKNNPNKRNKTRTAICLIQFKKVGRRYRVLGDQPNHGLISRVKTIADWIITKYFNKIIVNFCSRSSWPSSRFRLEPLHVKLTIGAILKIGRHLLLPAKAARSESSATGWHRPLLLRLLLPRTGIRLDHLLRPTLLIRMLLRRVIRFHRQILGQIVIVVVIGRWLRLEAHSGVVRILRRRSVRWRSTCAGWWSYPLPHHR